MYDGIASVLWDAELFRVLDGVGLLNRRVDAFLSLMVEFRWAVSKLMTAEVGFFAAVVV